MQICVSPLANGLRRTPPKENGNGNGTSDHKKEPVSPRSGRSSASSTPAPNSNKKAADDKPGTPKPPTTPTAAAAAAGKALPFGLPGFPGGPPVPPGAGLENGFRPSFDPHQALRATMGMPPGGKP